jgi:hypothetical protein
MNEKSASAVALDFSAGIEARLRSINSSSELAETVTSATLPVPQLTLPVGEVIAGPLRHAEEQAALSGRFDPRDLFDPDVSEDVRQIVLSRLVLDCSIEPHEGGVRWLLSNDRRIVILQGLLSEGRLTQQVHEYRIPTDQFGEMLRKLLLEGADIDLDSLAQEELQELVRAIEATSDLGLPHPDLVALRQKIERSGFLADYDVLLANGFFGRSHELAELRTFVASGKRNAQRTWAGLILTGLGGAGKSTLLAKFAQEMFREQAATVVVLDFDRPGIDPKDLYWLEIEMSRQVGKQYPDTRTMLQGLRRDVRRQKNEADIHTEHGTVEWVREERSFRRVVSGIRDALAIAQASKLPFLLVLDTFEEVTQRNLEGKLLEWLNEIGSRLGTTNLRVIFSGRIYDRDFQILQTYSVTQVVAVAELEPQLAADMLIRLGLSPQAAGRLANSEVLPRRPLELKLLAKLVDGDDEQAVEDLEREIREGGDAARELFVGIVYRRVLQRISNKTARALAYPGLVLRYVTSDLIQQVLVPALELPVLDDEDAAQALDTLASYGWLAYRGPKGEVYHRKDLRRSMLRAMVAKEGEKAGRISKLAAEFFSTTNSDNERAEGLYHRLMLVHEPSDADGFELIELKQAYQYLEPDLADFPPPAAALVKFAANGNVTISEINLLPLRHRREAYEQTGKRLVNGRELGKALELYSLGEETLRSIPRKAHRPDAWEREALFATASWDLLPLEQDHRFPEERFPATIKKLADMLFPAAIVRPDLVAADRVEQVLIRCAEEPEAALKGVAADTRETTFQRLAMGLILMNYGVDLSEASRGAIGILVKQIRQRRRPELSPALENRLLLLDLLSHEPGSRSSLPGPKLSTSTIRLSLDTLHTLTSVFVGSPLAGLVSTVTDILFAKNIDEHATVRQTLGSVDELASKADWRRGLLVDFDWDTQTPENLLQVLRGPDPEFRDPCRFALLDAFPDPSSHLELGKIFASTIDLKLEDLDPSAFAAALAVDPEHALGSYVELVDRCWSLGPLLDYAASERPTRKLGSVLTAYQRWDVSVRATILNAFKPI